MQVVFDHLPEKRVKAAQQDNSWTLANAVLYRMCREHPAHTDANTIVSKFVLIGRTYAAAVDRRRTSDEEPLAPGEDFHEHRLAPAILEADFDRHFAALENATLEADLLPVVKVHNYVTETLKKVTRQRKVSLASKYLHFHFPDLFFIYDNRAWYALDTYLPNWSRHRLSDSPDYDKDYYKLCLACRTLRDGIHKQYGVKLTPREIDNLLLTP